MSIRIINEEKEIIEKLESIARAGRSLPTGYAQDVLREEARKLFNIAVVELGVEKKQLRTHLKTLV